MLNIAQIIISLLLITTILLQQRDGGLSSTFGGGDGGVYRTRRGVEKSLFVVTIILAVLFLATAVLNVLLK
ncbi:MAG: preprotein translocase subunit SecG [bacterium]|nr:preprotein translocase subunit SecG [bacterium]